MEVMTCMKKALIAASIILLLHAPLVFPGCNAPNPEEEGFAIYLTRDNIPPSQMEALSHIEIADEPIISSDDIISYDKNTHEIVITAEAFQRIEQLEVPTSGKSFVVCVDKGPIYWGAFWTPVSSQSFNGITIWVPSFHQQQNIIRIELGYPSESFYSGEDPRSNTAILKSLEKTGKLK